MGLLIFYIFLLSTNPSNWAKDKYIIIFSLSLCYCWEYLFFGLLSALSPVMPSIHTSCTCTLHTICLSLTWRSPSRWWRAPRQRDSQTPCWWWGRRTPRSCGRERLSDYLFIWWTVEQEKMSAMVSVALSAIVLQPHKSFQVSQSWPHGFLSHSFTAF